MKGLIHIYCGDGKGKTTAATGLAVRAAGTGYSVIFARFLKTDKSGELDILKQIPQITMVPCEKNFGFFKYMTEEEKEEAKGVYGNVLKQAIKFARGCEDRPVLLVMDEIIATYGHGLVDRTELLNFLTDKPDNVEVVMTGRNPASELLELADYVSELKKIKHPFDQGIYARKGIEY